MRNRGLHDALRNFALEAAAQLTEDVKRGAELRFDVAEEPRPRGAGVGPVLYRYRTLTASFIDERWPALRDLPTFEAAAGGLGSGAAAYLRLRGQAGDDPEPALRTMIDRLYEDATGFEFPEERFERVYAEVERTLYETSVRVQVVAPLHGLRLTTPRIELRDGLAVATAEAIDVPDEAVRPVDDAEAVTLCVLERDMPCDEDLPFAEAGERFRRLLTALRLMGPGVTLGAFAWGRADQGLWQAAPLGSFGDPRGGSWKLSKPGAAEAAEFLEFLEGPPVGGAVDWALRRFEMGCERALEFEALSDHLMALDALLVGRETGGRAGLPLRVAALCAEEDERRSVQRGMQRVIAFERAVMQGDIDDAALHAGGSDSPRSLALEVEGYLRALLRDVLRGYLDRDLREAADDILLASDEPIEIEAHDLRAERAADPVTSQETVEFDALAATREVDADGELLPDAEGPDDGPEEWDEGAEYEVEGEYDDEHEYEEEPEEGVEDEFAGDRPYTAVGSAGPYDGVTPSADWGVDEDPESYSAPV